MLCGVSTVSALHLVIIIFILKVLLTKLPHMTLTTIRYRPTVYHCNLKVYRLVVVVVVVCGGGSV